MPTWSVGALPLEPDWFSETHSYGEIREIEGFPTIFRWHCKTMMRRIIVRQRTPDGKIHCINSPGWICRVCKTRRYRDGYEVM